MFTFLAPIVSLFIFILGSGFFPTLLALKLNLTTASDFTIGLMSALYYAGLIVGAYQVEKMICRVGYIRAYAIFASSLASMMMLCGVFDNHLILFLLRFCSGVVTAGVYVIIESWLLGEASVTIRGKILALYMISFYLAHSFGHFFLNVGKANDLLLFAIASTMCSLSVIPLALSKVDIPKPHYVSTMRFREVYARAKAGMAGTFVSGLLMGAMFGLGPIFFSDYFKAKSEVAFFMFSLIFGGMLLQYPVGKWSDKSDKHGVLRILSVLSLSVIGLTYYLGDHYWFLWGLTGLLGGFVFSIYPVGISTVCDNVEKKDIVNATESLLVVYSLGAMLGPVIASCFMQRFGGGGLYFYFAANLVLFFPLFLGRATPVFENSEEKEEEIHLML
jgi:MFS family permease